MSCWTTFWIWSCRAAARRWSAGPGPVAWDQRWPGAALRRGRRPF